MELNQEHFNKLDELVTLITISKEGTIAFVDCNEPILRDELYDVLKNKLESLDTNIIIITLKDDSLNFVDIIRNEKPQKEKKSVFFIYGIENASKVSIKSGKSAFLKKLNIMRDDFSNINQPIIIWSNDATISKIAIEAPDFWSWRTTVFEFRMEKEPIIFETDKIIYSNLEGLTLDELNKRYMWYSNLLEEYKKKNKLDYYKYANWYIKLGIIHYLKGEYDEALEKYNQSLGINEKLGDQRGISSTLHQIAMIHQDKGEYEVALDKYNQSLEIFKKLGEQLGISSTLHQIAIIHQDKGEYDEALNKYNQSLGIKEKLGDQRGIAQTLHQIANVHYVKGEYDEALNKYNQSLGINEKLGDKRVIAQTLHQIAMIHQDMGEYDEALDKYNQSLGIKEKLGNQRGMAYTSAQIGLLYLRTGEKQKAIEFTQKALDIFQKIGLENEAQKAKAQIETITKQLD